MEGNNEIKNNKLKDYLQIYFEKLTKNKSSIY